MHFIAKFALVLLIFQKCNANSIPDACMCPTKTISSHGLSCSCSCDLSGMNYTSLQTTRIPKGVDCLNLSHNAITNLSDDLHHFQQLKVLDLSFNRIKHINKATFSGNVNLLYLNLRSNRDLNISVGSFDSLTQLLSLHIEDITLVLQDKGYLFQRLQSLEELHIDGSSKCQKFADGFSGLENLHYLYIYGDIDMICNDTFEVFKNSSVVSLSVRSGELCDLQPMAFAHFKDLKMLNLNDNANLGFVNMSHGWYGLQYTNIETLFLQNITQVETYVIELHSSHLMHLNKTELKHLYLDKNSISHLVGQIFPPNVPHIETLSLTYNSIQFSSPLETAGFYLANIMFLEKLVLLDGSYQMNYFNPSSSFGSDESLSNKFEANMSVLAPPNLKDFIFVNGFSHMITTLTNLHFTGVDNLRLVDISNNRFVKFSGPFILESNTTNHTQPMTLRAAGNQATYLAPDVMKQTIYNGFNISVFDLADNRLGAQLQHDDKVFQHYMDLRVLNISNNGIKSLFDNAFQNVTSLEILNLSRNSLTQMNFLNTQMTNLQVVDLSNNLFTFVDQKLVQIMRDLIGNVTEKNNHTLKFDFMDNPLICSCETLHYLLWIKKGNQDHLLNVLNYTCLYNASSTNLTDFLNNNLTILERHCASKAYVIVIGASVGLFLFFAVLSFVIYRHHWDLRFYFIQLVTKRKQYYALEQAQSSKYDAFISYHIDDIIWVKEVLLPELEQPEQSPSTTNHLPFKLCLHHRDFLPGTAIQENIIDAINDSFKTILVLTRNFVQSEWCEFELQMARMKCFDKGRDIIVVIMLEPVPASMMSKTLQAVIKRNTFIEWPQNRDAQAVFWRKVKESIRAPETKPLVCECGRYVRHED